MRKEDCKLGRLVRAVERAECWRLDGRWELIECADIGIIIERQRFTEYQFTVCEYVAFAKFTGYIDRNFLVPL